MKTRSYFEHPEEIIQDGLFRAETLSQTVCLEEEEQHPNNNGGASSHHIASYQFAACGLC